jgi:hypothetical protein
MPRLSKIGAAALAAFGWTGLSSVSASYLVVAGGGGGGQTGDANGGGGAGGLRSGTTSLNPTLSYTVTVGAGGNVAVNGSNSLFSTISATGGGAGATRNVSVASSGGSGGGGSEGTAPFNVGGSGNAGSYSPVEGFAGGTGASNQGAGGGGAGAVGGNAVANSSPGNGGAGSASSITGSSVTYAGGGAGGNNSNTTVGSGGSGGGGNGATYTPTVLNATSGTANLGGGGGGGASGSAQAGRGGSGVVIISYVGAQQFGGGVVTSSGGNTIHTFTTSGTLSPLSSLTASYLIVAGGAGGGTSAGGGGGAGGLLSGSSLTLDTNSIYAVTVGAGGAGSTAVNTAGANGSNSLFSMVSTTAVGGGGGGGGNRSGSSSSTVGSNGGSGGGGAGNNQGSGTRAGGTGTSGQGNAGGLGGNDSGDASDTPELGGGGGGASAVGQDRQQAGSGTGGAGGAGTASSISGSSVTYAGGGGGGARSDGAGGGAGGSGGGGAGTTGTTTGVAGTANLGGGGGGGGAQFGGGTFGNGGNGGAGVVIISYAGSTQQMAGGTVTVAGGNVIHTFTSSGYLTPIVLVNNSLRFRSSASAYLNRTFTQSGDTQKFTQSVWCKRGTLGAFQTIGYTFFTGTYNGQMRFNSNNTLDIYVYYDGSSYTGQLSTTQVFRDPSAWYHFVLAVDTTQATASNRIKFYVNGVQVTAFGTANYPNQNQALLWNASGNTGYFINAQQGNQNFFDGYLAELNYIDGQALTPNSFGTSNGLGVWQPIRYGGSYGTNGFYLPFPNSGAVTANYLVVAGGGGGGIGGGGGGGGAGGLRSTVTATGGGGSLESALTLNAGNSYTVTVGAGGAGGISEALGTSGSNSVFSTITSTGGGGGSYASSMGGSPIGSGALSGGSGGGGSAWRNSIGTTSTQSNASGTANQGFAGGSAGTQTTNNIGTGGGGGGAGAVGVDTTVDTSSGAGGAGVSVAITGSSVPYGGGGGGGGSNASAGTGGSGGGGNGSNGGSGSSGTANRGGGGGGGYSGTGGSGGSGVVIVSYSGTPKFTGGVVSQVGGNTIHTFTSSGTLAGIGSDYSPNGNNWTPNNFSFSSGSTYDSMTDVPTLTSTTAANYATFNGIGVYTNLTSNLTYSNGNLQITYNNDTVQIGSSIRIPNISGKYYLEFTAIYSSSSNGFVGLFIPNNAVVLQQNGTIGNFGSCTITSTTGVGYSSGQIISFAIDADTKTATFRINNTVNTVIDFSVVPTGDLIDPAVWLRVSGDSFIANYGQQPFTYTPPTGFVGLNTFNLPTPTIGATASTLADDYFNAVLYTGNGTTNAITGVGFQPDFVWLKGRSDSLFNGLYDAVRGAGSTKGLYSNDTVAEGTYFNFQNLISFDSNGFTLGATVNTNNINLNAATFVGWNWKANGAGSTNTNGSIISTVSANTTSGFSIVTWTGNGTGGATVGHGLGVAPSMVIVKRRSAASDWPVSSRSINAGQILVLNSTNAASTDNGPFASTYPSSTVITLGTSTDTNANTATYVAYCFAQVAGYSAFGSYTGNGSSDGPFVFTGFRPKFIMIKRTDGVEPWLMIDSVRQTYNAMGPYLLANASDAEGTAAFIDFLSNGFKLRSTGGSFNASGGTYIYMAFCESPFKFSNAR